MSPVPIVQKIFYFPITIRRTFGSGFYDCRLNCLNSN